MAIVLAGMFLLQGSARAWNIPGHMIIGAMAHRILQANRETAASAEAILQKHPWYAERWRPDLEALPESQRGEMLFMIAARWADEIRTKDKAQDRGPWHYINWPFKPDQETVETKPAEK